MTDTQLGDLMRRTTTDLDPAASARILDAALRDGARRRRGRRLAAAGAGLSTAAVVAVTVAAAGLAGPDPAADDSPEVAATTRPAAPSSPPATAATYAPGSETEVPGGPVVPSERRIAADAALLDAARATLPDGVVEDLAVARTGSRVSGHVADRTRDGRRISLSFDGAGVSVTIQRWDGYAAVGVANMEEMVAEPGTEPVQRAALTAREACAGAYHAMPPLACAEDPGGWHRIDRPSQGAAMPETYQELYVVLFTDDGWAVTVDSYNTPAEKGGPPVAEEPVLSVAESLALARSADWFVAG